MEPAASDPAPRGRLSRRPLLAWLPLGVLLALAATLAPFRPVTCEGMGLPIPQPTAFEVFANLVLFLPIGASLRGVPRAPVLAGALALSGAIEIAQAWLPRVPSLLDVMLNVASAGIGHLLAGALPLPSPRLQRRAVLLAAACFVVALGVSLRQREPLDLSNWEPYPLWLGRDPSGRAAWPGTVRELCVFDHALDVRRAAPLEVGWAEGGPILRLRPREGVAALDGPEGPRAIALEIRETEGAPGMRVDDRVAAHLVERLRGARELALRLRVRAPPTTSDSAPARIVALARTQSERNLIVGQIGQDVVVRLRTAASGPGTRPQVRTRARPLRGGEHWIAASFDGETLQIGVDGRCYRETILAIESAPLLLGSLLAPSIVTAVALAALAGALLARRGSRPVRLLAFLAAGAAAFLFLFLSGAWGALRGFGGPALALGGLGLLAAAPCARSLERRGS